MGWTSYSTDARTLRATAACYDSAPVDVTFTQQRVGRVHDEMDSTKVVFREARDSEAHPHSFPIILALDVTGSMGAIPKMLIADGLPKIMGRIIQNGCPDAALCFLAIGDHECDGYPVQAAQFESGDAELDMWLTRTYLEGGGGGNAGESYPLAWDFAANRVQTDAWDKRKEKGLLFTIGDEPFLKNFPASAFKEIYGSNGLHQKTVTAEELFAAASEKFDIYHLSLQHGYRNFTDPAWVQLLGPNCVILDSHTKVPDAIIEIVEKRMASGAKQVTPKETVTVPDQTGSDSTVSPML